MKKAIFSIILLFCSVGVFAQTANTVVNGIVLDSLTQMPLPYTAVFFQGTTVGTLTDNGGRFSFSIAETDNAVGEREIVCALSDYKLFRQKVSTRTSTSLRVFLQPSDLQEDLLAMSGKYKEKPFLLMLAKAVGIVVDDYVPIGNPGTNKMDFGRVQTLASYNHVEGIRLRGGVASTARLHSRLFVRGYAAYGIRDKQLKYRGEAAWAFNNPVYHENEFPKNNLRFIYEYDVNSPGESHSLTRDNDELLYSFRRAKGNMVYLRFGEVNYERESLSGLSCFTWIRAQRQTPVGELYFIRDGVLKPDLKTTFTGLSIRYSPREAFRQNRRKKTLLSVTAPVFFLSHTVGLKNVLGGEHAYQKTEFSAQKRFLLGAFGHIDATAEAQRVWTKAPFPLLLYPNANQSYVIENASFSLLNAMEFINDEQYMFKATYVADYLLLARVPWISKLSLREVVSLRGVYGRLSEKNNPLVSTQLFAFPANSGAMENAPYWEAGVGIGNILGFFRLDYVFRLNYRDKPGTANSGVRVGVSL